MSPTEENRIKMKIKWCDWITLPITGYVLTFVILNMYGVNHYLIKNPDAQKVTLIVSVLNMLFTYIVRPKKNMRDYKMTNKQKIECLFGYHKWSPYKVYNKCKVCGEVCKHERYESRTFWDSYCVKCGEICPI